MQARITRPKLIKKKMNKPIIAKINDKFETLLLIIQAGALIIITIATAVAIVAEGYDMFVTKSIGLATYCSCSYSSRFCRWSDSILSANMS